MLRFAEQQVHMIGHDDVSVKRKLEAPANSFEPGFEYVSCRWVGKEAAVMPAGEGYEVRLSGRVKANKPGRHAARVSFE